MSTEASLRHRGIIHQRIVKSKKKYCRLCYPLVRGASKIESNITNLHVNATHLLIYIYSCLHQETRIAQLRSWR